MECMAGGAELKSEVSAGHSTVFGTKPPGVQFTEKGMVTVFQHWGQLFTATDKRTVKKKSFVFLRRH